jgi:TPR repeat protein
MKAFFAAAICLHISALQAQSLERDAPSCEPQLVAQAREGAEVGNAKQTYLFARYLSTGKCVSGDGKRAAQLYLKAEKLDYPPAFYNLGIIAAANQDFTSAEGHFAGGAMLGHRGCELQLGILYSLVPPPVGDNRKAYAWLLLTESRHEPVSADATEQLARIRPKLSERQRMQAEALSAKLAADYGSVRSFEP